MTHKPSASKNILFITGTDTGVGKTVLTGLLLAYLRRRGCRALAMKPFCSGGLDDVQALQALQVGELSADEMNPFRFDEPVAPLVAARRHRSSIPLSRVVEKIRAVARRCEVLLVEGAGGLLVPLGEGYTVADLISRLRCEAIVVGANRLGIINHTMLTVERLREGGTTNIQAVLMEGASRDLSAATNERVLTEMLGRTPLTRIKFLGCEPLEENRLQTNVKNSSKSLARICASSNVCVLFFANPKGRGKKKSKKSKKVFDNCRKVNKVFTVASEQRSEKN